MASAVALGAHAAPVSAAAPAGCRNNSGGYVEFCDQVISTVGARGGIGLLGDSVLLGSATGMSTPSLPTMLSANGFGPIRLSTTLGMATYFSTTSKRDASAFHWIGRWKTAGFNPGIIVVNIGANELGTCIPSTVSKCKARVDLLLNEIAAKYPTAEIWWAKIVQRAYPSGAYTAGMLGWNAGLDLAAAERPNLLLWDWPTALATANPPIKMDIGYIHPTSGVEYAKRSTIMADHITTRMSGARYVGPRTTLPAGDGTGLTFVPVTETAIYATPTNGATFGATETRDIDLSGVAAVDDAATALALTVTAKNPTAGGWLTVWRCGDPMPATSNVNFTAGAQRTAQVLTRVTAGGHVCVYSSVATDVVLSIEGNFVASGGTTLTPIAPVRPLDTRNTGRHADLVVPVPGSGVAAAAITLTATGGSNGGTLTAYGCDASVPDVANISFQPNETVASAAFVPVSADGTICVHVNNTDTVYTDVIVDITGTFQTGAGLAFVPAAGTRVLDTRYSIGGWVGRHGVNQSIDVVAAPAGALAATGTLTVVRPMFRAYLKAYPCGQALPPTSSVNANAGLVMANSVTVGVDAAQHTMCIFSSQNTSTLFDVVGWWVEAT